MSAGHGCGHRSILFGYLSQNAKTMTVAAMPSVTHTGGDACPDTLTGSGELDRFRWELYASCTARADAPFELTDAILCADGPVRSLVELSLVAEHRRGHGALHDALACGVLAPGRLRRAPAALTLPR